MDKRRFKQLWLVLIISCISISFSSESEAQTDIELNYPLDSLTEIITQSGVGLDTEISSDGNGSLVINTSEPVRIELIELDDNQFKNKRLTYKAKLRSENLEAEGDMRGISFIELVAKFADGEELVSRGPRVPVSETTDWRTVDTVLYIDSGDTPESVKLNLIVEGKGAVWIDSLELQAIPLRLNYLFWGHIVVWVVLIIYIYNLLRKNRELKKELDALS